MNRLEEMINYITEKFNISSILLENIVTFFNKVYSIDSTKLDILDFSNISMSYTDEILFEWIINNNYLQIRIREDEIRLEAKLPNGERFNKMHPVMLKLIPAFEQCMEILVGDTING